MSKGVKGSVLLATMLIAIIVAMLCGSYMSLVMSELRFSTQSLKFNAATNLAEAGVEEALWHLENKNVTPNFGWTITGSDATKVLFGAGNALLLEGSDTGGIRIRIDGYGGANPIIISEGYVQHPNLPTVSKQIRVNVKPSSGSLVGLIVKNNVIFNNRPVIDSYDSSKGPYQGNASLPGYNRGDLGAVVSLNGTISINDAQIWGRVGVGGTNTSAVNAPMNGGFLLNSSSPAGTTFDQKAITTGVKMTWPAIPTPPNKATTGGSQLSIVQNTTIDLGNAASTTPSYYYFTDNGGTLSLTGTTTLNVIGPVVLVIQRGLSISNTAGIRIAKNSNAKLEVYCSENINISGNGILNQNPEASRLTLYGCGGAGQNIAVGGSNAITGVFYGPEWNINFNSSMVWNGAVLAAYANFSSGNAVHYDSALGASTSSSGVKILSWQVLKQHSSAGSSYSKDTRAPFDTKI